MAKSADAFRTISEVADWLGSPAHVLRFWESKFTQVKPVKRAGGRRYYRPADMLLLGGIKKLLHDDGMTIKGVQKVLREHGVKHVSSLSHPLDEDFDEAPFDADVVPDPTPQEAASESAQVLQFQRDEAKAKLEPQPEAAPQADAPPVEAAPAADIPPAAEEVATSDAPSPTETEAEPEETVATEAAPDLQDALEPTADPTPEAENVPEPEPSVTPDAATLPAFLHRTPTAPARAEDIADAPTSDTAETPATVEATPEPAAAAAEPEPQPTEPEKPRPAIIELPDDPSDDSIDAAPGLLATIAKRKGQSLPIDVLARASAERDRLAAFIARQSTR